MWIRLERNSPPARAGSTGPGPRRTWQQPRAVLVPIDTPGCCVAADPSRARARAAMGARMASHPGSCQSSALVQATTRRSRQRPRDTVDGRPDFLQSHEFGDTSLLDAAQLCVFAVCMQMAHVTAGQQLAEPAPRWRDSPCGGYATPAASWPVRVVPLAAACCGWHRGGILPQTICCGASRCRWSANYRRGSRRRCGLPDVEDCRNSVWRTSPSYGVPTWLDRSCRLLRRRLQAHR